MMLHDMNTSNSVVGLQAGFLEAVVALSVGKAAGIPRDDELHMTPLVGGWKTFSFSISPETWAHHPPDVSMLDFSDQVAQNTAFSILVLSFRPSNSLV